MKNLISNLLTRLGAIGSHPKDNAEVKMQKSLLIAFSGIMGPLGLVWSGIYYYFNEPIAAAIPFTYSVVSLISLWIFSKVKSYKIFRFSQLMLSLILPFFLMLSLGGYLNSSAVIMWSLSSPLGALVFMERKKALYWFAAYIGLLVVGMFLEQFMPATNNLSEDALIGFFVMNILGTSLVSFVIVHYFVGEKNLVLRFLEKKNAWIKEAFSAYVSPNLVKHLMENPDKLKLGGERRECTFVFTDLEGFTPMVEESDPEEIMGLLNEYIDKMTEIIFKYEGTIDKIVGDSIAVMFSAPVHQEDHAERGVMCAMEMDRFAREFSKVKREEGIALGGTRIGVNTGTVIVGNVGSKSQFDYTAIGDTVNTTSRLEGANKYLGTRICVSQATYEKCHNIRFRKIGSLMLVGKSKEVQAYEPIDGNDFKMDDVQKYQEAFDMMQEDKSTSLQLFKDLLSSKTQDTLTYFQLNRLESGEVGVISLEYK